MKRKKVMTKSIRLARDYDVQVRYENDVQFMSIEGIEVNGKSLLDHLEEAKQLRLDFNKFRDLTKAQKEIDVRRINKLEDNVETLSKVVKELATFGRIG